MLFLTEAVYLASSVHNEVPQTAVIHSLFFSRPFEKKTMAQFLECLAVTKCVDLQVQ